MFLVSESGKSFVDLREVTRARFLCLSSKGRLGLLGFVKFLGVRLPLRLQATQEFLVLPADGIGEDSDDGVISSGLEAHNSEGGGNDDSLLLIVRSGDSVERRQASDSGLTACRFLVNHTADRAPDHHGGALVVERTLAWVGVHGLVAELSVLNSVADHCKKNSHISRKSHHLPETNQNHTHIIVKENISFRKKGKSYVSDVYFRCVRCGQRVSNVSAGC